MEIFTSLALFALGSIVVNALVLNNNPRGVQSQVQSQCLPTLCFGDTQPALLFEKFIQRSRVTSLSV